MSRSKESKEQDVPGDVKDAFDSLEQKLDAGLADLMADEGTTSSRSGQKIEAIDDDDVDDDINIAVPNVSRAALAAADDGAREAEAMARRMAEEAASFATAVAATTSTVDDVTSSEEHLANTMSSCHDLTEDNKEEAQTLQAAAIVNASQSKSKDKSSKQISLLLLGLLGLILALGVGSIIHKQATSNHLESNKNDDHRDGSTLFDIIKEWNTRHEKEQRYNEAMRNMLNPEIGENNVVEKEEPYDDGQATEQQQEAQQQYLIPGDGRMATLINTLYQPVYYVTYRPVQRLRYYYYHQTPPQQEEVVMRHSRSGGGHQTVTYRKAKIVQNVHLR